jgi:hypothetical protein
MRKYIVVMGFAGCVISIASVADAPEYHVVFDNNGYPPSIGVQMWLDDTTFVEMNATCAIDSCETEPTLIPNGRHRLRLRVVVDNQLSPFTTNTIER